HILGLAEALAEVQATGVASARQQGARREIPRIADESQATGRVGAVRIAVATHIFKAVVAAIVSERDRRLPVAEALANTEVELVGKGNRRVVVEDPGFAAEARRDGGPKCCRIAISVVPRQLAGGAGTCRKSRRSAESHADVAAEIAEQRLERGQIKGVAVVIAARATEEDQAAITIDVVGNAETRLERALERMPVVARGD